MKPLWPPRSTSTTKTSTLDSPHKKLMKLLPRPTHNSLLQTRTTCTGYVLTPSAKHLELAAQSKRKTEPTLTNLFTTGTKNLRVYTDNQSRQDTEVNTTPQTQPASAILWNLETQFPSTTKSPTKLTATGPSVWLRSLTALARVATSQCTMLVSRQATNSELYQSRI